MGFGQPTPLIKGVWAFRVQETAHGISHGNRIAITICRLEGPLQECDLETVLEVSSRKLTLALPN